MDTPEPLRLNRRRFERLLLFWWPVMLAAIAVALIGARLIRWDDTTAFLSVLPPAVGAGVGGALRVGSWPARAGRALGYAVLGAIIYCAIGTAFSLIVAMFLVATA